MAAGTDKAGKTKKVVQMAQLPFPSCPKSTSPSKEQTISANLAAMISSTSPEPGSVTPLGGPPKYPPPALPPGVAPPAPPPGIIKTLPAQLSTTTPPSIKPPPVPSRSAIAKQISVTQPPQPPPRPK